MLKTYLCTYIRINSCDFVGCFSSKAGGPNIVFSNNWLCHLYVFERDVCMKGDGIIGPFCLKLQEQQSSNTRVKLTYIFLK